MGKALIVEILGDARGFGRELDKAAGKTRAFGKVAGVAGLAIAGGLAYGLEKSVSKAADFERSLNSLQAVAGLTKTQMSGVSQLAIKLGNDTKLPATSAQDAANAMTEMVKAGVSVKDTMAGVRNVLVLSAAAGIDNAHAAEIASNAMNTFGIKGKDLQIVTDALANTANASSVEITDVADSMKMAGAVFSSFQGDTLGAKGAVYELNTAIGLLGNAGIKGSDAGTSLKQALLQLAAPASRQKNMMHDLYLAAQNAGLGQKYLAHTAGMSKKEYEGASNAMAKAAKSMGDGGDIAYDAAGKMRSFHDIIRLVTLGTKGMDQETRNYYVSQIFGADATRSVLALMKEGEPGWDRMAKKIRETGTANDLAAAKMKGLRGGIDAFKGSLETLEIVIGQMLLPVVTQFAGHLANLTSWFAAHPDIAKAVVWSLGLLAAALLAVNVKAKLAKVGTDVARIAFIGLGDQATISAKALRVGLIGALAALTYGMVRGLDAFDDWFYGSKSLESAQRDLASAVRDVRTAMLEMKDADLSVREANLNHRQTTLSLIEARRAYRRVLKDETATSDQRKQAALDLKSAELAEERSTLSLAQAHQRTNEAGIKLNETIKTQRQRLQELAASPLWEQSRGELLKTRQHYLELANQAVRTADQIRKTHPGVAIRELDVASTAANKARIIEQILKIPDAASNMQERVTAAFNTIDTKNPRREVNALGGDLQRLSAKQHRVGVTVGIQYALAGGGYHWQQLPAGVGRDGIIGADGLVSAINMTMPSFAMGYMPAMGPRSLVGAKGLSPAIYPELGLAQSMGLSLTSGFRPGSKTVTGARSLHSVGKAIDVAGSPGAMSAFARAVVKFPGIREVLYSPVGGWYPGVGWTGLSGALRSQHYSHVHVGVGDGTVGTAGRGGGGGSTTVNVYVQGWVGNDHQLANKIRNELVALGKREGSIFAGYA